MADTIEVLQKIERLFRSKGRWTSRVQARTKAGKECSPRSPRAYRFDVVGAAIRFSGGMKTHRYEVVYKVLEAACEAVVKSGTIYAPRWDLPRINDTRGLSVVREIVRTAVAVEKAREILGRRRP